MPSRNFQSQEFRTSGGASAVKEPGHFEVRKSSGQVTQSPGRREGLACCSHYYRSKAIGRAVDLPARSFDLARPAVAPPLFRTKLQSEIPLFNRYLNFLITQYRIGRKKSPSMQNQADPSSHFDRKKGRGRPYSITKRRVPELIPVLCSQPAGEVSHKPGGRLPLLSDRPPVTPTTLKRAATNFAVW